MAYQCIYVFERNIPGEIYWDLLLRVVRSKSKHPTARACGRQEYFARGVAARILPHGTRSRQVELLVDKNVIRPAASCNCPRGWKIHTWCCLHRVHIHFSLLGFLLPPLAPYSLRHSAYFLSALHRTTSHTQWVLISLVSPVCHDEARRREGKAQGRKNCYSSRYPEAMLVPSCASSPGPTFCASSVCSSKDAQTLFWA